MGLVKILALIAKAADLAMTMRAENRAATQAEVDALFAAADSKDATAVAADDAAQKAAAQQP